MARSRCSDSSATRASSAATSESADSPGSDGGTARPGSASFICRELSVDNVIAPVGSIGPALPVCFLLRPGACSSGGSAEGVICLLQFTGQRSDLVERRLLGDCLARVAKEHL